MTPENHGFALWHNAIHHFSLVDEFLRRNFVVERVFKISWSEAKAAINFNRIYGRDIRNSESRHLQVGTGPFYYWVIKDNAPKYSYYKNVSGKVEYVNINVSRAKNELRELTKGAFKYFVHSSNNAFEFQKDFRLIFGKDPQLEVARSGSGGITEINHDLIGSNGWDSVSEAMAFANTIEKIVLLRGDPENLDQDVEIDLLCRDPWALAGYLGASKISNDAGKFDFSLPLKDGGRVKLDCRTLTDNYFPAIWAERLFQSAVEGPIVSFLDAPTSYFSGLYHEFMHKQSFRAEKLPYYRDQRHSLIHTQEKSSNPTEEDFISDLKGYLLAEDIKVSRPLDRSVYFNLDNARKLLPLVEVTAQPLPMRVSFFLKEWLKLAIFRSLRYRPIGFFWSRVKKSSWMVTLKNYILRKLS